MLMQTEGARQQKHGPVRVTIVSDALPERNGVGAYYCDLMAQLSGDAFDCQPIGPAGPVNPILKTRLPGDGTQRLVVPSPFDFGRCLENHRPDVVVCATPGPFGLAGTRWARKLKARLLVGFHTDYASVTDVYHFAPLRLVSRKYCRTVDRWMFRNAEQVLCNAEPMIELANNLGAKRTTRIGTLLPPSVLQKPVESLPGQVSSVLFAGRLAPEKRLDQVIEAARQLPQLNFTVVGEGPLRRLVQQAASELANLNHLGWLNRADLVAQIDAHDVLVLPSKLESFGSVAFEAMARARLVAVTETCGIADWPQLAAHLTVFSRYKPLHQVLAAMAKQDSISHQARAHNARQAALQLNDESLAGWQTLLNGEETD
ncbi:MAG: glycosyltransferase [Wenzhouxiangella sp.]|jgi:glycosyltransferase involved in cell wall biosynthesis|nr:glycosyltransferase [Wenzhouxiangella sp.]